MTQKIYPDGVKYKLSFIETQLNYIVKRYGFGINFNNKLKNSTVGYTKKYQEESFYRLIGEMAKYCSVEK